MAGLCWMAVTLSVLLYAGSSFADVDQNHLAGIVKEIVDKYRPSYKADNVPRKPMFSLAVSIPYDEKSKKYDISQVFNTDPADTVKKTILKCEVYKGTRMVAATVLRWPDVLDQCPNEPVQWDDVLKECRNIKTWSHLDDTLTLLKDKGRKKSRSEKRCFDTVKEGRADHAEYRTLQAFNTLVDRKNKNDLLLFYVLASPCSQRCTGITKKWSILENIKKIMKWKNYALVFSNVFKPRDGTPIPEKDSRGALERLGESIGLKNIFRCDKDKCTSCSSGNQVTRECYT
ncbi:uncharacterized protein LOC113746539 [Larimichthys crocea]|uniref:uncharacterized protein LOC113746539 n=1 Tax=Larimichthys crocea TaxID=215358 RepID=UPI000F5F45FD|nr:uncharacterized protein LOC113746539 [Larimichthys crocea]